MRLAGLEVADRPKDLAGLHLKVVENGAVGYEGLMSTLRVIRGNLGGIATCKRWERRGCRDGWNTHIVY